ncbi:MAG: nucleotide exchange factor GrpE [Rhodospirillales bacterium 12-54-5]|nr:MAG: nucleotide exchange factor GrpE [Rhodospirillales bacterium 12-54-5]
MTLKELLGIFERQGIKRIDPMGQKFDHNLHQAVAQIETPDAAAGTVVQVLQAGYTIHDRLLRPAMVGVAAGVMQQVNTSA